VIGKALPLKVNFCHVYCDNRRRRLAARISVARIRQTLQEGHR
jgi:hypothetical protein